MSAQQFHIVFKGELVKGASAEQVQNNLAKLFKAEPAKLNHLFAGKAVIIKKGLDRAGADKYEAVLRRAGAVVEIIEASKVAPPTAQQEAIKPAVTEKPSTPPQAPAEALRGGRLGRGRSGRKATHPACRIRYQRFFPQRTKLGKLASKNTPTVSRKLFAFKTRLSIIVPISTWLI